MKVVLVTTIPAGGPVSHLLEAAPPVARRVEDLLVVCATTEVAERFQARGLRAVVAPVRSKWDLGGARRMARHLRAADVVHTHDRRAGLFGRIFGRLSGGAVVHTFHGFPEEIAARVGRPLTPLPPGVSRARALWLTHGYLRLEGWLARLGAVTTPSHAAADFLIRHGIPRGRIHVIPSGVTVHRPIPGLPHETCVVGAMANLEYWKGIDVLIEACSRASFPIRLEVIGDGGARRELEELAVRLGVAVRFHGRVADPGPLLREIDVFALPSRAENLPMAVLEAMAQALPVVATRVGGVPELVEDGITGRLVEADDPASLAQAIDEVAGSPDTRSAWGAAGARRAATAFDPEAMADRSVRLYSTLLERRGR